MLSFSAVLDRLRLPPGRTAWTWWHEPKGHLHHWHRHAEPEFNLVLRGTARYLFRDRVIDLGPGSLIWLFPAHEHLLVEPSRDFACWIAVIRPMPLGLAAKAEANAPLRERDPACDRHRVLTRESRTHLDRLCDECAATQLEDAAAGNAAGLWLFLAAWRAFLRAEQGDRVELHPAVRRAARLLAEDPEAELTQVARLAGLSSSRLSRLFHGQIGSTLVAYRSRMRIERFLRLRREHPGRTLLSQALEAGFGSYAQFHRAFSATVGVAPARFIDRGFVPGPVPRSLG